MKEVFIVVGRNRYITKHRRKLTDVSFIDRIKLYFTRCNYCKSRNAWESGRYTSYCDTESNIDTLCKDCWDRDDEFNEERWTAYHSSCF